MLFYFLFPFFLVIAGNLRVALISFALLLTTSLITTKHFSIYLDGKLDAFGKLNILAHAQYFIIGFIIYHVWLKIKYQPKPIINGIVFIFSIVSIILFFRLQKAVPEEIFISLIGSFLLLSSVLGLPKTLDNKVTRYLWLISYSTYLMQFPVISLLTSLGVYSYLKHNAPSYIDVNFIAGIITVVVVIGVSSLTYQFIEKPFRNIGKKVAS